MLANDVVEALKNVLPSIENGSPHSDYQGAFEKELKQLGLDWKRPRLPNAGGYAQPDLWVPGTQPPLLIEFKVSGDWRAVAEAAAQLYGYAHLLSEAGQAEALKLAVFGGPLQSDYLRNFLEVVGITFICKE